jgi:hypothetical protein
MKWMVPCFLMAGLLSCKTTHPSQLKHDEGRFLNHPSSWQWLAVDRTEFLAMNSYRLNFMGKVPIGTEDPRQKRAEALLQELVRGVMQNHPELAGVPPLNVILLAEREGPPDGSLNAAAWDGERCYGVQLVQTDAPADAGTGDLRLNPAAGMIEQQWSSCDKAVPVPSTELDSLRDWLQFHVPDCRMDVKGNGLQTQGCNLSLAQGKSLSLPQMVNWISVDIGLLAQFTDAEVKGVLAHEISHYYLAHSVQPPRLYNYFFKNDQKRLQKPLPDPAAQDIAQRLRAATKALRPDRPVTGARYHPLVLAIAGESYLGLNFGSKGYCRGRWFKDVACTKECDALQALGEDRGYFDLLDAIQNFEGLYASASYLNAEKVANSCLASLKFKSLEAQQGFLKALNGQQSVMELPIDDKLHPNLDAYFQDLTARWSSLIEKHNEAPAQLIQSEAIDQDLGFYTREVEADELGLEIYRRIGEDPQVMIEAFIKVAEDDEAAGVWPAWGEVGGQECRRLLKDQWPQRPPIARFTDDHLSPCYRAFNIAAELKRHPTLKP